MICLKKRNVLLASGIGFFTVLSFWVVRKLLSEKDCGITGDDYHFLYAKDTPNPDEHHGIEYYSVK